MAVIPPLVTLADAKMHLRITDSAHDTDVQLKLTQAQATILDYLAERVDDTWTEITVPPLVVAGILMYLTHLYEHRGDDMGSTASGGTADADVWEALRRLLARLRDQAVGVGVTA